MVFVDHATGALKKRARGSRAVQQTRASAALIGPALAPGLPIAPVHYGGATDRFEATGQLMQPFEALVQSSEEISANDALLDAINRDRDAGSQVLVPVDIFLNKSGSDGAALVRFKSIVQAHLPHGLAKRPTSQQATAALNMAMAEFKVELVRRDPSGALIADFDSTLALGGILSKQWLQHAKSAGVNLDLCGTGDLCAGNLGIARSEMPQLEPAQWEEVGKTMEKGSWYDHGGWFSNAVLSSHRPQIKFSTGFLLPTDILTIQREINVAKVFTMAAAVAKGDGAWLRANPITVVRVMHHDAKGTKSARHFALDGHHRLMTELVVAPNRKMKVLIIDLAKLMPDVPVARAVDWMVQQSRLFMSAKNGTFQAL